MQNYIKIKMQFKCIIGILDFERTKKQKILVKLKAGAEEFLDYALICKTLKKNFKEKKFNFLEEALQYLHQDFKKNYPSLSYLKISIYKLHIIKKAKVGVCGIKKY